MESAAGPSLLNLPTELRLLIIEHALYHGPEPLPALVPLGFRDEVYEGPTCNMTVTLPAATLDALSHSCPDRGWRGRFWLPLTKGLGGASKQLRDEVEDVWGNKLVTAAVSRPSTAQRFTDIPDLAFLPRSPAPAAAQAHAPRQLLLLHRRQVVAGPAAGPLPVPPHALAGYAADGFCYASVDVAVAHGR